MAKGELGIGRHVYERGQTAKEETKENMVTPETIYLHARE